MTKLYHYITKGNNALKQGILYYIRILTIPKDNKILY